MPERFEITRLIGKNGTGGIYEANDKKHNRKVLLHRFFSEKGDTSIRGWELHFKDIARQWALVKVPGFMKLHEADIDEDGAFMSLHYFESKPLLVHYMRAMHLAEFRNFAQQACKTLEALHLSGIVHGALAPNSFLVSQETVNSHQYILWDLGFSHLVPKINRKYAINYTPSDPAILAPEIFEGLEPAAVTDIYMLGHIFYYMLANAHPLAELPLSIVEKRHIAHDFPRIDDIRPHVPTVIGDWIESMIQAAPKDRLQTIKEVLATMPEAVFFQDQFIDNECTQIW